MVRELHDMLRVERSGCCGSQCADLMACGDLNVMLTTTLTRFANSKRVTMRLRMTRPIGDTLQEA